MGARAVGPWVGEQKLLGKTPLRGNPSPKMAYLPTYNHRTRTTCRRRRHTNLARHNTPTRQARAGQGTSPPLPNTHHHRARPPRRNQHLLNGPTRTTEVPAPRNGSAPCLPLHHTPTHGSPVPHNATAPKKKKRTTRLRSKL